jgi:hypothetical protein
MFAGQSNSQESPPQWTDGGWRKFATPVTGAIDFAWFFFA